MHSLRAFAFHICDELDEMKRHNQKTIKILAAVITGLLGVIGWLVKEWPKA